MYPPRGLKEHPMWEAWERLSMLPEVLFRFQVQIPLDLRFHPVFSLIQDPRLLRAGVLGSLGCFATNPRRQC